MKIEVEIPDGHLRRSFVQSLDANHALCDARSGPPRVSIGVHFEGVYDQGFATAADESVRQTRSGRRSVRSCPGALSLGAKESSGLLATRSACSAVS